MRWRRLLWLSFSALLAWWLYLYLPPKPRWTLPEYEVPLKANAWRIATMVLDPDKHNPTMHVPVVKDVGCAWLGPVRLRDAKTGKFLAGFSDHEKTWSICRVSSDLRFVLCESFDRGSISCYDFTTGSRWKLENVGQSYFAPQGTLVHVWLENQDQLRDAATGQLIAEFAPSYRWVYRFAADDSWGLFAGSEEGNATTSWLLWRREGNIVSKGVFPGLVQSPGRKQGFQLAPDGHTAAIQVFDSDRYRLLLWDILRGVSLHELNSSAREGAAFEFSPDGRMLAVWWAKGKSLELFEVGSGRRASSKHAAGITDCAFSANGELLSCVEGDFPQTLTVLTVSELRERWRVSPKLEHSFWLKSNATRLLMCKTPLGVAGRQLVDGWGAIVVDGETGQQICSWQRGDLSWDNKLLIRAESTAHGRFGTILHWLPWTKSKEFMTVSAERLDDGKEVFRRAIMHSADERRPDTHSPYCDNNTFVLMCAGRDTEVWDLPPAKRWGWIVGPPAVMIALPWLWRFKSRKKASPNLRPVGQATT